LDLFTVRIAAQSNPGSACALEKDTPAFWDLSAGSAGHEVRSGADADRQIEREGPTFRTKPPTKH
jgi:hypothetical protein